MAEIDPVCGKSVDALDDEEELSFQYKKRRYFFCSERCRRAFEQNVERERLQELAQAGALLSNGRVRWGVA
ncbi:MAG: YHS domain-containing protein [Myxococcales bacterium]|jgi:YHS domain-containing protein|nr:YHS domain-containing protein [Myxococcales bacterium]